MIKINKVIFISFLTFSPNPPRLSPSLLFPMTETIFELVVFQCSAITGLTIKCLQRSYIICSSKFQLLFSCLSLLLLPCFLVFHTCIDTRTLYNFTQAISSLWYTVMSYIYLVNFLSAPSSCSSHVFKEAYLPPSLAVLLASPQEAD